VKDRTKKRKTTTQPTIRGAWVMKRKNDADEKAVQKRANLDCGLNRVEAVICSTTLPSRMTTGSKMFRTVSQLLQRLFDPVQTFSI
jgi:hypothetical protein